MQILLTLLGLNAAHSAHACVWCNIHACGVTFTKTKGNKDVSDTLKETCKESCM